MITRIVNLSYLDSFARINFVIGTSAKGCAVASAIDKCKLAAILKQKRSIQLNQALVVQCLSVYPDNSIQGHNCPQNLIAGNESCYIEVNWVMIGDNKAMQIGTIVVG